MLNINKWFDDSSRWCHYFQLGKSCMFTGRDAMSLSKADIVDRVTETIGFTRGKFSKTVECPLETIMRVLESGDVFLISGFGKFILQHKATRKGRNPATGGEMMLPPRKRVAFKCSGKLRESINSEG
jgi:integration host factor subunit alpha